MLRRAGILCSRVFALTTANDRRSDLNISYFGSLSSVPWAVLHQVRTAHPVRLLPPDMSGEQVRPHTYPRIGRQGCDVQAQSASAVGRALRDLRLHGSSRGQPPRGSSRYGRRREVGSL